MNTIFISTNRKKQQAKPCVRGTKVTVSELLLEIADDDAIEMLAVELHMKPEKIQGALRDVARFLTQIGFPPLPREEPMLLERLPQRILEQISDVLEGEVNLAELLVREPEFLMATGLSAVEAEEKILKEVDALMNSPKPPCRVRVRNGDQSQLLGMGTYEENVSVYCIQKSDGSLRSLSNAEERPPDDMLEDGDEIVQSDNNPKIRLDNGQIVYGCQVWWEAVDSES